MLVMIALPFPTCVGMNRSHAFHVSIWNPVPYVRGDEP